MTWRSAPAWAFSFLILAIVGLGVAAAFGSWFPVTDSIHGAGVQRMLDYTLVATGAFFVAGHLALAYLVIRSVRRPGQGATAPRREWVVGLVPAVVMALVAEGGVLLLGLPVWATYYGPPPADALAVEVTSRQFFWAVRYPGPDGRFGRTSSELVSPENPVGLDKADPFTADDVVLLNELRLPVNRPVALRLRSLDVIHSFFLPTFRVKQDAMPGMTIPIWFTPTRPGEFEIACNQICGLAHYRMRGFLYVQEPEAFSAWLAEQKPFFESL